jgi:hypothetical protein
MNLSFTVGSKTLLFSSQCDFFIFLFKKPFFQDSIDLKDDERKTL